MARANRRRVFRLPRRADQWRGDCCISLPRRHPLASAAAPAQPESAAGMDADGEAGGRVPPQAAYPAPLAQCTLCRQTLEVGAECPNWARSDLCGLRLVSAWNSVACDGDRGKAKPAAVYRVLRGVRQRPLRSVNREGVGRNESERRHSPEIDRGGKRRPYLSMGKAVFPGTTR